MIPINIWEWVDGVGMGGMDNRARLNETHHGRHNPLLLGSIKACPIALPRKKSLLHPIQSTLYIPDAKTVRMVHQGCGIWHIQSGALSVQSPKQIAVDLLPQTLLHWSLLTL